MPPSPFPSGRSSAIALLAATAFVVAACGGGDSAPVSGADVAPRRAVVIAPAAAEMMDALGLADRVVGVGQFGPWPESFGELPVAGSYNEPNVETVLTLRADALISARSQAALSAHGRLRDLGVRVLELDTSTHDGVFAALAEVGRAFGREERAGEVARAMRDEIAAVERRATGAPHRKVLFVVGRDPLYVAGPGSHIDRMIRGVGGTNVAHDALSSYQQISVEAILERQPDVIIDTSDNRPGAARGRVDGEWGRWEFLPAVKRGRVYRVDPSRLVIPGMRLPAMTRMMGRLIHPEIFGEPGDEEYGPLRPGEDPDRAGS